MSKQWVVFYVQAFYFLDEWTGCFPCKTIAWVKELLAHVIRHCPLVVRGMTTWFLTAISRMKMKSKSEGA